MGRQRKLTHAQDRTQIQPNLTPAPFNQTHARREPAFDRLVSTLMLAGEAMASPLRNREASHLRSPRSHPEIEGETHAEEFTGLLRVIEEIRGFLAQDVRATALVAQLPESIGDGDALRLLFRQLFRCRTGQPLLNEEGQPILSRRELDVLREATCDLRHEEIAQRLGISTRTVGTHFENIYRKLGVRKPMQAVARAVTLGYLDLDAIGFVNGASQSSLREYSVLYRFLSGVAGFEGVANAATLKPMAEFGLLLMIVAGAAASLIDQDQTLPQRSCAVCEINSQGEILRTLGSRQLYSVQGLVVAPLHAARHGFIPGHIFAVNNGLPQQNLNSSCITEFTQEGEFVRMFRGAPDISLRMTGCGGIAFALDGRLLVTSGYLTEGILAFSDGGASVRRFTDGMFSQVCIGPNGAIYASQSSSSGSSVKVYDSWGRLLETAVSAPAGIQFGGVAVDSRNYIHVSRAESERYYLEEYDPTGQSVSRREIQGMDACLLAINDKDQVYVPCRRTNDVKIFSLDGRLVKRLDFHGRLAPTAVSIGELDKIWIAGSIS